MEGGMTLAGRPSSLQQTQISHVTRVWHHHPFPVLPLLLPSPCHRMRRPLPTFEDHFKMPRLMESNGITPQG